MTHLCRTLQTGRFMTLLSCEMTDVPTVPSCSDCLNAHATALDHGLLISGVACGTGYYLINWSCMTLFRHRPAPYGLFMCIRVCCYLAHTPCSVLLPYTAPCLPLLLVNQPLPCARPLIQEPCLQHRLTQDRYAPCCHHRGWLPMRRHYRQSW